MAIFFYNQAVLKAQSHTRYDVTYMASQVVCDCDCSLNVLGEHSNVTLTLTPSQEDVLPNPLRDGWNTNLKSGGKYTGTETGKTTH